MVISYHYKLGPEIKAAEKEPKEFGISQAVTVNYLSTQNVFYEQVLFL